MELKNTYKGLTMEELKGELYAAQDDLLIWAGRDAMMCRFTADKIAHLKDMIKERE